MCLLFELKPHIPDTCQACETNAPRINRRHQNRADVRTGAKKNKHHFANRQPTIASSQLHLFYHQLALCSFTFFYLYIFFFIFFILCSSGRFLITFDSVVNGFGETGGWRRWRQCHRYRRQLTPLTLNSRKIYISERKNEHEIRQSTCLTMIWIEMFVKTWKWKRFDVDALHTHHIDTARLAVVIMSLVAVLRCEFFFVRV